MKSFQIPAPRSLSWGLCMAIAVSIALAILLPEPVAKLDPFPIRIVPIVAVAFGSVLVWGPILLAMRRAALAQCIFICMSSALFWGISGASIYGYLNTKLDAQPPQSVVLVVTAKHVGGKSSRPYRLQCSLGSKKEDVYLAVSRTEYESVQVGDRLAASVHDGAFGLRWLSSYNKMHPKQSLELNQVGTPPLAAQLTR